MSSKYSQELLDCLVKYGDERKETKRSWDWTYKKVNEEVNPDVPFKNANAAINAYSAIKKGRHVSCGDTQERKDYAKERSEYGPSIPTPKLNRRSFSDQELNDKMCEWYEELKSQEEGTTWRLLKERLIQETGEEWTHAQVTTRMWRLLNPKKDEANRIVNAQTDYSKFKDMPKEEPKTTKTSSGRVVKRTV